MKKVQLILTCLFLMTFNKAICQSGAIQVVIINSDSNIVNDGVFVELVLDTQKISEGSMAFNKPHIFGKLSPGIYKLTVRHIGNRLIHYDSLLVNEDQTKELTIFYPGPCQFIYNKDFKPKCPFGHKDNIVPIVYGLPNKHHMNQSRKGKIHLGGCMITDCDPRFYCRLHKLEI